MSLERIQTLRAELHEHNRRYYVEDAPSISDAGFDALLRELQDLEAQFPGAFDPNSPTQRVGGTVVKSFDAIAHKRPMLSLSNSNPSHQYFSNQSRSDLNTQAHNFVVPSASTSPYV